MLNQTGARLQESLREHPALAGTRKFYRTLKGVILSVHLRDTTQAQQTLVDISLYGGYPNLAKVPVMTTKFNQGNGEEWTPEAGDIVLVTFINGEWIEPVVIGQIHLPQSGETAIQADSVSVPFKKRRYHRRCNKTDLVVDKDGNRIEYVEGYEDAHIHLNETRLIDQNRDTHVVVDETLTIDGKRTTIIEGNESLTVNSGDITIEVASGKCTVHVAGKTAWTSDGTIELDGGSGAVKGLVQGDCICPFIKKPHIHISATVKGSK